MPTCLSSWRIATWETSIRLTLLMVLLLNFCRLVQRLTQSHWPTTRRPSQCTGPMSQLTLSTDTLYLRTEAPSSTATRRTLVTYTLNHSLRVKIKSAADWLSTSCLHHSIHRRWETDKITFLSGYCLLFQLSAIFLHAHCFSDGDC